MIFDDLLASLKEAEPELWKAFHPRIWNAPGGYASGNAYIAGMISSVAWAGLDGGLQPSQTMLNVYAHAALARRYGFPRICVGRDLCEAALLTRLPRNMPWADVVLPYPSGALMLPDGFMSAPSGGRVTFLAWSSMRKGAELQFGSRYKRVIMANAGFCVWTGLVDDPNYPLLDTTLDSVAVPLLGDVEAIFPDYDLASPLKIDLSTDEGEFMARARHLVFSLFLLRQARPYLYEAETRTGLHKKSGRDIYTAPVLGMKFRLPKPHQGGTHASPLGHWVSGHVQAYHVGTGRKELRLVTKDPYFVEGSKDDS